MNYKNKEEVKNKFDELSPFYKKLSVNVKDALIQFLNDLNIDYLDVETRVKDFDSFYEKITRKGYKDPFNDTQDICGLRIINYYTSDLNKIASFIKKEFNIIESVDKQDELNDDSFGYRSFHFIVKLKKEWTQAPNYRGLEDIAFEIQARTILMHGWASINHKLLYKNEDDIPKKFKRDLFRLSALIELADEQFEKLRIERETYAKDIINVDKNGNLIIDSSIALNVDSVQAILNFHFQDRNNSYDLSSLIEEMKSANITLEELNKKIILALPYLDKIESDEKEHGNVTWAQVGAARTALDLTDDKYYKTRSLPYEYDTIIQKYRKQIKQDNKTQQQKSVSPTVKSPSSKKS